MIHRLTIPSIAIGLLIAPAALAQMSHPNSGPAAATASKDALGQQEANFVKEATAGGMAEIELSKIAEKRKTRRSNASPSGWCMITQRRIPSWPELPPD